MHIGNMKIISMHTCSHTQMLEIIRSRDEKKNTSIMKKEFLTSNFSKIAIFCRFVVVILHESNSNLLCKCWEGGGGQAHPKCVDKQTKKKKK